MVGAVRRGDGPAGEQDQRLQAERRARIAKFVPPESLDTISMPAEPAPDRNPYAFILLFAATWILTEYLRALTRSLADWVSKGTEPPASVYPMLASTMPSASSWSLIGGYTLWSEPATSCPSSRASAPLRLSRL